MKKSLLFLLLFPLAAFAQDTVTVRHTRYTTTYDTTRHFPVLVHWLIRATDVSCPVPFKRTEDFRPDSLIGAATDVQQYFNPIARTYDRGHNMDADDNECDLPQMHESFLFSNMTAQHHSLNRGVWKSVEGYTQKLALKFDSVEVWSGSFGDLKHSGRMVIPAFCWKIIRYHGHTEAYCFPNDATVLHHKKEAYIITVDKLRTQTHLPLTGL